MSATPFADRLFDAIEGVGTAACVGLDPDIERLPGGLGERAPAEAIEAFSLGVLEAIVPESGPIVAAVKAQSACYERYVSGGVGALERTIERANELGLVVILDAKRGDIGVSARHYAAAAVGMGAHAITVNAYLGPETVEPYLEAGLGVFVLVRTSNPGSDAVQSRVLRDDRTVAEMMADHVAELGERYMGKNGYSSVGAVVGATKPGDAEALRNRMPRQFFLVPGFGAQGGTVETVRGLVDEHGGGVLVSASRSVIYAGEPEGADWRASIRSAASAFADEVRALG